ncbi:Hypothetical predicted protein [Marmota monax]|uniref:Transporter n=1 Tax=Marmota monax TaxID=9995 RepID=A0A5E4BIH0_MARMO|nr:hypothetical protein GHT09_005798 [Marmota monax]VTJ68771.1 Hypothetical predicted protein [Marmota monax]
MPKNSKVTQREHSNEHVTESVADLLALEEPVDYKQSVLNVSGEAGGKQKAAEEELDAEDRPAWNSKLQYILAQIGFSVGLGNIWRFPYLCQKNGGGAYLVPYLVLLIIIGIPLFFLELAVGQRIRRGSIGVWHYVCPRLGGIGFSSCIVCLFVGLYYNVIIGWSIFYFFKSFQYPLPWSECPVIRNGTMAVVEAECEKSSATTYFWYREALDISNSISESGGLNWKMTLCLLVAWSIVGMAVVKGIQSSGKVMYFSSLFPYVVLACFLVRGLLLRGAVDGILHMFTPKEGSFRGPVTSGIKKVPESSELPLESHSPQGDQQKLCSPYIEGVDKAQVSSRRTPSFPKDGLSPPVVSPLCGPL